VHRDDYLSSEKQMWEVKLLGLVGVDTLHQTKRMMNCFAGRIRPDTDGLN
jgi:hypothetical protein